MPDAIPFRTRKPRHDHLRQVPRVLVQEDGVKSLMSGAVRAIALAAVPFASICAVGQVQSSPAVAVSPPPGDSGPAVRALQDQVRELRSLVDAMRAENAESRAEM